ncbi:hypothetical protein RFZ33_11660, partial [Acinetobacter baumannii]|nr:hypothetical protein [Acinetobacter baumannii]
VHFDYLQHPICMVAKRLKPNKERDENHHPFTPIYIYIYIYICSFPVCTQNKPAPLERLFTALQLNFKAI